MFLNPSVSYGVTDDWTVGIRHFVGVCPSGEDNGCEQLYDDVSVDTLYSFGRRGPVDVAARAMMMTVAAVIVARVVVMPTRVAVCRRGAHDPTAVSGPLPRS